jgi:hypothetical protein
VSLGAKLAIVAAAAALTVALFFVLRPGGDDDAAATTPTAPGSTAQGTTAQVTTVQTSTPRTLIELTVENGKPAGGIATPKVTEGDVVQLLVTADVSDEVHLHGYDLSADVAPGLPAAIQFEADTVGRFEIELENRKEVLAELSVEPS